MTMESFCWTLPGKQEHSSSHVLSAPGHATQQQLLHMCKAPQAHSMVITVICPLLPAWGWVVLCAGRWWQGWCSSISSTGHHSPRPLKEEVYMHTCLSAHTCARVHMSRSCDIAPLSLRRRHREREGDPLVLPLYTNTGGRELLLVLDVGLTWTTLISIFAVPCSLKKRGNVKSILSHSAVYPALNRACDKATA